MYKISLLALLASSILSIALAACPNKCSGHGTCGTNDICSCAPNWVNSDCSGRRCNFQRAWHDVASYTNDAHFYRECSNRGQCDRTTGLCNCDPEFTGAGCRRLHCPNDCSGHGVCRFIEELATNTLNYRDPGTSSFTYTHWDQEKIQGCVCDAMWEGHACELQSCPRGDDPLTTTGSDMQQAITLNIASITFSLTYYDLYGNAWKTAAITAAAMGSDATTCASIQTALRRLPNNALSGVTVAAGASVYRLTRTSAAGGTLPGTVSDSGSLTTCIVTFPSGPGTSGLQNLLVCDLGVKTGAGYQPVQTGDASAACNVYEHSPSNSASLVLTENAICSNRGNCNYQTGKCECYSGHKGIACETQEALV